MTLPPPSSFGEFVERCRCLCALYDCSQTSGLRTKDRNLRVGGHPKSRHLGSNGGWAWDIVPDENNGVIRQGIVRDAKKLGLQAVDESDHVHLQARPWGYREGG